MDEDLKTWLYDILQSINEIDSYYEDRPKVFEEYVSDIKTKRATERDLEIIGEAVNRIFKRIKTSILKMLKKLLEPEIELSTDLI